MKIKKKVMRRSKDPMPRKKDSNIFLIVILIILLADILLMLAVFPLIDSMTSPVMEQGAADSALMFKTTLLVTVDIALFVSLFMFFSRRSANKKR